MSMLDSFEKIPVKKFCSITECSIFMENEIS
jgi:hypothetical protein